MAVGPIALRLQLNAEQQKLVSDLLKQTENVRLYQATDAHAYGVGDSAIVIDGANNHASVESLLAGITQQLGPCSISIEAAGVPEIKELCADNLADIVQQVKDARTADTPQPMESKVGMITAYWKRIV